MSDRKKVLVAEEAKSTREMLTFLLANRGYEVIEATTGREVLEIVKTFTPDLVVLGADLSDVSGYDVFGILKARPASRQIPVLLLVAFTDAFSAPTRTLPDPEFLLSKPFTAHDFLQRAGKILADTAEPAQA